LKIFSILHEFIHIILAAVKAAVLLPMRLFTKIFVCSYPGDEISIYPVQILDWINVLG
jgi:hypothetical protein